MFNICGGGGGGGCQRGRDLESRRRRLTNSRQEEEGVAFFVSPLLTDRRVRGWRGATGANHNANRWVGGLGVEGRGGQKNK